MGMWTYLDNAGVLSKHGTHKLYRVLVGTQHPQGGAVSLLGHRRTPYCRDVLVASFFPHCPSFHTSFCCGFILIRNISSSRRKWQWLLFYVVYHVVCVWYCICDGVCLVEYDDCV